MFQDLIGPGPSRRLRLGFLYGLLASGALLLALVDPKGSPLFPQCPLRTLTGLHCPGCGGLRAVHQALRGQLRTAFGLNPLLFALIPLAAYPVGSDIALMIRDRPLPRLRLFRGWWVWLGGSIAAFGILRNIPWYPFSLLGP